MIAEIFSAIGKNVEAEICAAGEQALAAVTDVTDEASIRDLVHSVERPQKPRKT